MPLKHVTKLDTPSAKPVHPSKTRVRHSQKPKDPVEKSTDPAQVMPIVKDTKSSASIQEPIASADQLPATAGNLDDPVTKTLAHSAKSLDPDEKPVRSANEKSVTFAEPAHVPVTKQAVPTPQPVNAAAQRNPLDTFMNDYVAKTRQNRALELITILANLKDDSGLHHDFMTALIDIMLADSVRIRIDAIGLLEEVLRRKGASEECLAAVRCTWRNKFTALYLKSMLHSAQEENRVADFMGFLEDTVKDMSIAPHKSSEAVIGGQVEPKTSWSWQ